MSLIHNKLNRKTMKYSIEKIMLLFLVVLIFSCKKAVLDQEPLDKYSDAAVWQDPALIGTFINNTYRIMPTGFYVTQGLPLSVLSDEAACRNNSNFDIINKGNVSPSSLGPLDYWTTGGNQSYYKVISKCNVFLENINGATIDTALKNRMIGEMKVLRAYSYFRLISFYGGVPLITKQFTLADDFSIPRNTYDECLSFIVAELDAASTLLPLNYSAKDKGRITKGAALAVKSRALLYAASPLNNPANDLSKWQKAADVAKAVIDLNQYALYTDYKTLFSDKALYNSEIIWSRPYNNIVDAEEIPLILEQVLFPNGYYGFGQVDPLQNLIDQYETVNGKLPKDDPSYNPQNPYVNRDPRFYATILYNGAPFKGRPVETFIPKGKDSPEGTLTPQNATVTGYYVRKYVDESIVNPSAANCGNTPWTFFRYAEILLNYAEAKYFLGDETTCREYINKVRSRASVNMPLVTESGAALLTRLQHEREIELAFEEHRYFDVRRWKIAPQVLNVDAQKIVITKNTTTGLDTYTVQTFQTRDFFDKNYLAPIPQSELDKDASLKQNPNY
ncbi:MAG: RagB/SusD protein [Ferruginibacter sp.]|nr:RagB/SusD protein [Ferruginibacter sp.]